MGQQAVSARCRYATCFGLGGYILLPRKNCMIQAMTRTSVLFAAAIAIVAHAQTARGGPPSPVSLKFSSDAAGERTVSTPFSLRLSAPGLPKTEFSIAADAGVLRVLCTWESHTQLSIYLTAAAGHGLPGRIGLATETGQSPVTIEVQVAPEQVARGPIYIEVTPSVFQRGGTGVVHGTIVASMAPGGAEKVDDQERVGSALEEGKLLTPSEVNAMEAKLKSDPHDWSTRLSLLAYYSSSADLRASKPQIVSARRRHILWVIENRPTATDIFDMAELRMNNKGSLADPDGTKEAEQAWQRAITDHSQNNQVLLNAAMFCATFDPAFSEHALQHAKSNSHDDPYWDGMLGWLYASAMLSGTGGAFPERARSTLIASQNAALIAAAASVLARPEPNFSTTPQPRVWFSRPKYIDLAEDLAARAVSREPNNPYWLFPLLQVLTVEVDTAETPDQKLVAEKKVYGLFQHFNDIAVDPGYRTLLLPVIANLAFDVKDDETAKSYATQALDLASQQGDRTIQGTTVGPEAVHDANDVLGRVALRRANLVAAKEYLLKAAAAQGGGTMSIVGPRMLLAQALLDRGEHDVVLQYLEKIEVFWKSGTVRLDYWIASIRKGKAVRLNLVDAPISALPR
jgi:hypothetical protein